MSFWITRAGNGCGSSTADWATLPLRCCAGTRRREPRAPTAGYLGKQGPGSQGTPRLAAYADWKTRNPAFTRPAIASLLRGGGGAVVVSRVSGPLVLNPVDEAPRLSTNAAAQGGLSAIEILELCRDQLPVELPTPEPAPPERGRRTVPNPAQGG